MLFMLIQTIPTERLTAARARFKEIGELPPVEGVTRQGRWFDITRGRVFSLIEADETMSLAKNLDRWTDLADIELIPVFDDQQAAAFLASVS